MHQHLVGLKVAVANTAAAIVPAAAVIQVSETAAQAQAVDHELVMLSLVLGIISSIVALAWNGFQWWRWWCGRRDKRDGGE